MMDSTDPVSYTHLNLINPDVSPEDEGANQMKMLYCSCPSEMRETLLHLSLIHI